MFWSKVFGSFDKNAFKCIFFFHGRLDFLLQLSRYNHLVLTKSFWRINIRYGEDKVFDDNKTLLQTVSWRYTFLFSVYYFSYLFQMKFLTSAKWNVILMLHLTFNGIIVTWMILYFLYLVQSKCNKIHQRVISFNCY